MANPVMTLKIAKLTEEFGLAYATRLFGAEAIESLPKFVRGKNAGKPKGILHWRKATVGGWWREAGCVVLPGLVDAWIAEGYNAPRGAAMFGRWLGRIQNLAGSACFLGEEGRARHARDEAANAATHAAFLAEIDKRTAAL